MFAFLASLLSLASADSALAVKLDPIADAHKGQIAIAVKSLVSDDSYFRNAEEPMPTASLIKLAIMVETYWQAEEKKLDLGKMLTIKKEDQVPGAGVLTDSFSPGATLAIHDAMRLMITVSDNTATNMVLDQIGIPSTNTRMESLGFNNTKIHAKVFKGSTTTIDKARSDKFGLGSTTAREMVGLLELIHHGKVVTPKACEEMISILKKNQDNELIVRLLPPGVSVAHKTGAVSAARTDAGIVYEYDVKAKKPRALFIICVLTNNNDDKRWVVDNAAQLTIAKVARAAYDVISTKK
jgi:beta-lactamase class A